MLSIRTPRILSWVLIAFTLPLLFLQRAQVGRGSTGR